MTLWHVRKYNAISLLKGHIFMHRPHADPFGFVIRYRVHASTSGFHISYPLNITLFPNEIARGGHSRAHFLHLLQKSCRPKSIGLSTANGRLVVITAVLKRGPRNGFNTVSPIRLSSPSPASNVSGMCRTWLSEFV